MSANWFASTAPDLPASSQEEDKRALKRALEEEKRKTRALEHNLQEERAKRIKYAVEGG